MFKRDQKVVLFAAHTDDEMICAGTLHRAVREGAQVDVVVFSQAATADDRTGHDLSQVVYDEWSNAMDVIGVSLRRSHRFAPSADFQPHRQKIAQLIYDYCEAEKPDVVFTLSPDDENTAHHIVGVESERVLRGRVPTVVRCQFPWNYSIGRPNLFVRLEQPDWEAKLAVIDAYKSQHFRYRYKEMLAAYCLADGLSVKSLLPCEKFEVIRSVV